MRLRQAMAINQVSEETAMNASQLVLMLIAWNVPSAFLAKTLASQKARHSNRWFFAGLLLGPLGLIAAAGLPDRHQIVYLRHLAESQGYEPKRKCGGKTQS